MPMDIEEGESDKAVRWHCIPAWYVKEAGELFSITWSMALYILSFILMAPVSLIFAGQLGTVYLDGVGLANTILNVTGLMIGQGLSTACDTLIAQAYGNSNNRKKVGVYLQRGLMIILLCVLPCWAVHLNTENLLIAFGQDPQIARISGRYVLLFMPALPAHFSYSIMNKYLRNQNIVRPSMIIGFLGLAVNALFQFIFVTQLDLGIDGSALSQVLGFYTLSLGTIGYIVFSGVYKETWPGWTMEALQEWGYFLKLAVAGLMMTTLQFWAFELGTLLSGLLGRVQLAAQTIIFQMESMSLILPMAVAISCNIRLGQLLGANTPGKVRNTLRAGYSIAWMFSILIIVLLLSLKDVLPHIFSTDSDVIGLASTLLPILAIYTFFDTTTAVSSGILRGCARQFVAAAIIFLGMYLIGLPAGISMMFLTNLKSAGFWLGMIIALSIEAMVYLIVIYRTNWEKQAKLTQIRIGAKNVKQDRLDERTGLLVADSQADMEMQKAAPQVLSRRQLLFRRSLFVLFMISVLCFGIFTRFYFAPVREMEVLCIPVIQQNNTLINSTVILSNNASIPLCNVTIRDMEL